MRCDHCQQNPARVRMDELVEGRRVSHFFCQSCVDELKGAKGQGFAERKKDAQSVKQKEQQQAKIGKCERCQQKPARVRVDELVDGCRVSHFLCQLCVDKLMDTKGQVGGFDDQSISAVMPTQFPETSEEGC